MADVLEKCSCGRAMVELPDSSGWVACVRCDGKELFEHERGPHVLAEYYRRKRESEK